MGEALFLKMGRVFWKKFKQFGEVVGHCVNFILLIPVYYVGIGITALLVKNEMNILREEKGNKDGKSYWKEDTLKTVKKEEYYRMF